MSVVSDGVCAPVSPPVPRREEDRVVMVGVSTDPKNKFPRQAETSDEPLLDPPVAVPDPYGWMRDDSRTSEEVLNHLKAENAYTDALSGHLAPLKEKLYQELMLSIQETDYTLPRFRGDFIYYTRTFQDHAYSVYCRAPRPPEDNLIPDWDGSMESPVFPGEQVLLDVNKLAKNRDHCAIGVVEPSPSHKLMAYTVDFTGAEECLMFIIDSQTGEIIDHDENLAMHGNVEWGVDDTTTFYETMDEAERPYRVYKRTLGSKSEDILLFEDTDETRYVGCSKTLDGKYLLVESSSSEASEYHYMDLSKNETTLHRIAKRRPKVLYDVAHRLGEWWISTNVGGTPNLRLMRAPADNPDCEEEWKDVLGPDEKPLFDGGYQRALDYVQVFRSHVVAHGREGGLPCIWVLTPDADEKTFSMSVIPFEEEAHDVSMRAHYEFDTDKIALVYDSLVTPLCSLEVPLNETTRHKILKAKTIRGYDKSAFGSDRVWVPSRDGKTKIPVLMVYRRDVMEEHLRTGQPVHAHLYGYGSYGSCEDADFRASRLLLLNRGAVCVLPQVRGGGELGRQWYEEPNGGKFLCKKNTFDDFVDVAKWLVHERKLTTPELFCCEGRSAGGLLIAASLNQAPGLFRMALMEVPFLDIVLTMSDASLPLTAGEWEEWGNPNEKKFFSYMMEYDPMQNVQATQYPAMLITAGFHDKRVPYWEAAKYIATLRHKQPQPQRSICFKVDTAAGHFSQTDRYNYIRERAWEYAFLLDQLGIADK